MGGAIVCTTDVDVVTPALDGTILAGVTRDSCLSIIRAHSSASSPFTIPGLSPTTRIHTVERAVVMSEVERWAKEERLLEAFSVGTAVTVALVAKIGLGGLSQDAQKEADLVFPEGELRGSIADGLWEALCAIQTGRMQYEDWSVPCA
jgi:branched-chain amino acid aminotransferase